VHQQFILSKKKRIVLKFADVFPLGKKVIIDSNFAHWSANDKKRLSKDEFFDKRNIKNGDQRKTPRGEKMRL